MFDTSLSRNLWRQWAGVCLALFLMASWGCTSPGIMPSWRGLTSETEPNSEYVSWYTSFDRAQAEAEASGKPLMLWFTGSDWCKYCTLLEKEVFHTAAFQEWHSDKVIPVMLDFPRQTSLPPDLEQQNEMLKDRYAKMVTSYPTALFVNAEGEVIGKLGYMKGGPDPWVHRADGILAITW